MSHGGLLQTPEEKLVPQRGLPLPLDHGPLHLHNLLIAKDLGDRMPAKKVHERHQNERFNTKKGAGAFSAPHTFASERGMNGENVLWRLHVLKTKLSNFVVDSRSQP